MHSRTVVLGAAALAALGALVAAPAALAEAPSGFKVTGGGQIVTDSDMQGPGDTVGFNAHELEGDDPASPDTDDAARGQFQYVPRGQSAGTNQEATETFHGVVTCLISGGEAVENEENEGDNYEEELTAGSARFGGYMRDDPTQAFTVDVTDNGQGSASGGDLILVRLTAQPCADNPEDEQQDNEQPLLGLGRGNVKIHNNPDGETAAASVAARLLRIG